MMFADANLFVYAELDYTEKGLFSTLADKS